MPFVPDIISSLLKWTGCASHNSTSSNAQGKNDWSYNSISPLHPFTAHTKISSHLEDDRRQTVDVAVQFLALSRIPSFFLTFSPKSNCLQTRNALVR
jgi:hypothetical protein